MAWNPLYIKDTLLKSNLGVKGISSKEVMSKLEKYGHNELMLSRRFSPLTIFLNQFKITIFLILIASK